MLQKSPVFLVGLNIYFDICVIKYIKCIKVSDRDIYPLENKNKNEIF